MTHVFTYGDIRDATSLAVIAENGFSAADWHHRDIYVLHEILYKANLQHVKLSVDVGCGTGRLLPALSEHCAALVGVEPDHLRARSAIEVARALPTPISIVHNLGELKAFRFDLALVAYVLQHLTARDCKLLLDDVVARLEPSGTVVLMLPLATDTMTYATYSNPEGRPEAAPINGGAFALPLGSTNILPVTHYSRQEIRITTAKAGLDIVDIMTVRKFHFTVNSQASQHVSTARDVALLMRKQR